MSMKWGKFVSLIKKDLQEGFEFDEVQVLTQMHKGLWGIENLNLLMMLENWFVNGKIELDKVLNEYLAFKESKEQLKTVPFNKYLFQYALKKGFDQTFTETIKNTFDELLRIEKETIVCTQS